MCSTASMASSTCRPSTDTSSTSERQFILQSVAHPGAALQEEPSQNADTFCTLCMSPVRFPLGLAQPMPPQPFSAFQQHILSETLDFQDQQGEELKVTRPNNWPRREFHCGTQSSLQHMLTVQHLSGTGHSKVNMAPPLEKLPGWRRQADKSYHSGKITR